MWKTLTPENWGSLFIIISHLVEFLGFSVRKYTFRPMDLSVWVYSSIKFHGVSCVVRAIRCATCTWRVWSWWPCPMRNNERCASTSKNNGPEEGLGCGFLGERFGARDRFPN